MSDLFGNHIVGFPTRRLNYYSLAEATELNYVTNMMDGSTSTCAFQRQIGDDIEARK